MKKFPRIHASRVPRLMVMLVALPLFSVSAYSQGRTVEIDIKDREYFPPARTLKIPPEFKEDGVRLAVRVGDTIKICNKDRVFAKPFSVSKENKFEGVAGTLVLKTRIKKASVFAG